MTIDQHELARRLKAARQACHLTQERVAKHLNVSRSTIAQIELGNREVTSLELDKLAYLYGRDIREFLTEEFRKEDPCIALFRKHSEVAQSEDLLTALRQARAIGRELTNLERALGLERDLGSLPTYPLPHPSTSWQAVEQGEYIAAEERRRLGLASAPLPDLMQLLESLGVRTAQFPLPEDISGLTLVDEDGGVLVMVNNQIPRHSGLRRRFSFAHEYCHVLLDRERKGTISRSSDRESLVEVRANAFAAAFLMPRDGVEDFMLRFGKRRASCRPVELYDEEQAQRVQYRLEAGSQTIQMHHVVLLAYRFGASRMAVLYRLKSLEFLSETEFNNLKKQEEEKLGKSLSKLLGISEQYPELGRNGFRLRFLALALEAFRLGKISRGKLVELARMVELDEEALEAVLLEANLDWGPEAVDVLLPESEAME